MNKLGQWFTLPALLLILSCSASPTKKLKIVVTTDFVADMVQGIAGPEIADVEILIKPGIDPHTAELSPFPTEKVKQADLVFANGLVLEDKLIQHLRLAAASRLEEVCDTLSPLAVISTKDGRDPHVWQDPNSWTLAGKVVMDRLAELRPGQKEALLARYRSWTAKATAAQERASKILETVSHERRKIITAHPGYRYFARQYSFEAITLEESIQRKSNLPSFRCMQFTLNSAGEPERLALDRPSGNTVLEPLGTHTLLSADKKPQTYPEWIVHNATLIANGLSN